MPPTPGRLGSLCEPKVKACQSRREPLRGRSRRIHRRHPALSPGTRRDAPLPDGEAEPPSGRRLRRPLSPVSPPPPPAPRMAGPARAACTQGRTDPLGRSRRPSPAGPPRAAAGPEQQPPPGTGTGVSPPGAALPSAGPSRGAGAAPEEPLPSPEAGPWPQPLTPGRPRRSVSSGKVRGAQPGPIGRP